MAFCFLEQKLKSDGRLWCTPVILAVSRLRQKDDKFKANLEYIARSFLKKRKAKIIIMTY